MSRISNWAHKRLLVGFPFIGNKYLKEGGHIGREFSQDDTFGDCSQRVGKVSCASGLQVDRYIKCYSIFLCPSAKMQIKFLLIM